MNHLNTFSNRQELDVAFAAQLVEQLKHAISTRGQASIAFSGGSTPKGLFAALSTSELDWSKVTITLVDDRWVDVNHENSNDKLLRENLLQNNAKYAKFFSLKQTDVLSKEYLHNLSHSASAFMPLDIIILGMGEDGHTASIFPCSEQLKFALDLNEKPSLIKTVPTTASYERVTFNFSALIEATHIYLHCVGESKMDVLNKAIANKDSEVMPISAFLNHPSQTCEIFWAE